MIALRICKRCGTEFDAVVGVNNSLYCDSCSPLVEFESDMSEAERDEFCAPQSKYAPKARMIRLDSRMIGDDPYAKLKTAKSPSQRLAYEKNPRGKTLYDEGRLDFSSVDQSVFGEVDNIDFSQFG